MKIIIIEDEGPAARQLEKLIREIRPEVELLSVLDSVEASTNWLKTTPEPDLIFMDIQLADGLSFDIFTKVNIRVPVIFTTAYDQFTLRAFKVNSVDYLLKPVEPKELRQALQKYDEVFQARPVYDQRMIDQLKLAMSTPDYKERFLVRTGQHLSYIQIIDIRYFYSEDGLVFAQTTNNKKHHVDYTLDQLELLINPTRFFRLNRKIITSVDAVARIAPYFNSRLILDLQPKTSFDVIVSRDRVNDFKRWLDQ